MSLWRNFFCYWFQIIVFQWYASWFLQSTYTCSLLTLFFFVYQFYRIANWSSIIELNVRTLLTNHHVCSIDIFFGDWQMFYKWLWLLLSITLFYTWIDTGRKWFSILFWRHYVYGVVNVIVSPDKLSENVFTSACSVETILKQEKKKFFFGLRISEKNDFILRKFSMIVSQTILTSKSDSHKMQIVRFQISFPGHTIFIFCEFEIITFSVQDSNRCLQLCWKKINNFQRLVFIWYIKWIPSTTTTTKNLQTFSLLQLHPLEPQA